MVKNISKKYLRKNEFRYNTSPRVKRPDGKGHVSYVSARLGHKYKINVITHSPTFFGKPTKELSSNPEIGSKYKGVSRFSVPVWEKDIYLKNKANGIWRLTKADKIAIKKFNKKYANNYKK